MVVMTSIAVAGACSGDNSSPSVGPTAGPSTTSPSTTTKPTTTTAAATTTTAKPATTAAATTAAPTSTPTTTPTTAASDRCHTSELRASLGAPNPGAGNVYVPLILTNISSRRCAVAGYPGVSLLDAAGNQIGQPADRETGLPTRQIPMESGATASAALHTVEEGVAPGGCWPESAKVKVFPPNELDALVIDGKFKVCGNMFTVRPLVSGSTGS
jgi:hypothetical protein